MRPRWLRYLACAVFAVMVGEITGHRPFDSWQWWALVMPFNVAVNGPFR